MTRRANATKVRSFAWSGILILPLTYFIIANSDLSVAFKVLITDIVVYLSPIALTFGVCLALARRSLARVEHWLWGVLTISSGCLFLGEAYWTWYVFTVDFHGPPLMSPVRLLYAVITAAFFVLVVRMSSLFEEPMSVRVRVLADLAGTVVTAYGLVYAWWMLPSFGASEHHVANAAISALFPVVGTVMFVAAVSTVSGWDISRWRTWERLLAVAYTSYALGLISFGEWYPVLLRSSEQTLAPSVVVLGCGIYFAFLGGVHRLTEVQDDAVVEMFRVWSHRKQMMQLYPAVLAAALPLLVWESRNLGKSAEALPLVVCALLLAVILAGRSWVATLDLATHRLRAVTDPLTSVYNSVYLRRRLTDVLKWAGDGGYPVSVVVADIDMFRSINNSYGHDAGDRVLQALSAIMNSRGPAGREVFRLGSDDFVALLPQTDSIQAMDYAIRVKAAAYKAASPNGVAPVGVSLGIATFPEHALKGEDLLCAARAAERTTHAANSPGVVVYDADTMSCERSETVREDLRLRALRDTVRALAAAVDARDSGTRYHSSRVSELAVALAERLGLPDSRVEIVAMAALMHDVGKIGIPDTVLLKPGPLLPEERVVVEAHCDLGERILGCANMDDILPIVRHHHERWDGEGYPDGLKGHDIPLEARILAVCDTYETLVSSRPYKSPWEASSAREELLANAGTQFDPMITASFVSLLAEIELEQPERSESESAGMSVAVELPGWESV